MLTVVPDHLENPDFVLLAFNCHRIEIARGFAQQRRQRLYRRTAGDDLARFGESSHACGSIDCIAEKITTFFDRRSEMKTDPDRERRIFHKRNGRDAALHVARRLHRGVGRRQYRHQFVADGLDDAAALKCDRFAQLGEHPVDRGERALIAELFIQAGTAAHVGKQDRAMRGCGCHSDRL